MHLSFFFFEGQTEQLIRSSCRDI